MLVSTAEQVAHVTVYECELLVTSNECVLINRKSVFFSSMHLEASKNLFGYSRTHG